MSSSGGAGIEVLAQVHRDADARGDTALASAATRTLAFLTHRCDPVHVAILIIWVSPPTSAHLTSTCGDETCTHHRTVTGCLKLCACTCRHSLNMETLKNCVKLLGDEGLPKLVSEVHMEQFMDTPPRSPMSGTPIKHFSLNISRSLGMSTCSTVMSDGDSPTSPPRKASLDGGSSRALSRMGSSMKSMLGSVRKLMRSDRRSCDDHASPSSKDGVAGARDTIDGSAAVDPCAQRLCAA